MSRLSVSIVIPTCQRVADLERCLQILVPQLPADGSCELMVSDDGDVKKTKEALAAKFPAVLWTQGPRRGPAANRNHGASATTGEWLIFVDDDVLPSAQFLCAYLQAIAAVGDTNTALEGATIRERDLPSLLWEAPHNPEGGILISCNFAISRKVYEFVGHFDERFPVAAFEDTEFSARLSAKGVRVVFVPEALLTHPLRPKPSARKLALRWEGNAIYAFEQGASALRVLWNLPWHALRVIQSRFRDKPLNAENAKAAGLFAAEWLWVLWLTPGWVRKWAKKQRSPFWCEWVSRHGPTPKYGF
jgi:GT2 family glycosyltransferase